MIQRIQGLVKRYSGAINYNISNALYSVVTLGCSIWTVKWIAPEQLGIWSALLAFQTIAGILSLGVNNGLSRELPYEVGRGNLEKASLFVSNASFSALVSSAVSALVVLVGYRFVINDPSNTAVLFCLIFMILFVISNVYGGFIESTYRSTSDFRRLQYRNYIMGAVAVVTVLLPFRWGFYGYVVRLVLLKAANTGYLYYYRPYKIKSRFTKDLWIELVKTGLPMLIFGYLFGVARSLIRIILLKKSDLATVGLFSMSETIVASYNILSIGLMEYVFPRLSFLYGKHNSKSNVVKYTLLASSAGTAVSLVMFVVMYFFLGKIIAAFYPKYIGLIPYLKYPLISGLFLNFYTSAIGVLNVTKDFMWRTYITVINLIACTAGTYLCIIWLGPLAGANVALLISNVLVGVVLLFAFMKIMREKA